MKKLFASRGAAAASASALTLLLAGGGYAIASSGGRTIRACVHKHGHGLYLGKCAKHDRKLRWNVRGVPGPRGATGAAGATGSQGPPGVQYAWSSFTYPNQARPQSDGHVATFTFTSPEAGFALVTAQFQVRVNDNGTDDCHVESQLASAPAVLGDLRPDGTVPSAGFVDEWINSNLPTENTSGGTYLGQNMSVSRVFPVTPGSNTVYLNGQYSYGSGGDNCKDALWGPITVSAVFANQSPSSRVTAP